MEEEKRSYRWLWAVIPAIVAVIALAICLKIFCPQTTKVPDHVVNISGSIKSAQPVENLVEATWSMQDQEMIDKVLAEPDKWQGYELTMRLTDKCSSSNRKLEMIDWFVNPGQRWIQTEKGYEYEKLPDDPMLRRPDARRGTLSRRNARSARQGYRGLQRPTGRQQGREDAGTGAGVHRQHHDRRPDDAPL